MSNIKQTKDGLIEKSTGRKIESPLERFPNTPPPGNMKRKQRMSRLHKKLVEQGLYVRPVYLDETCSESGYFIVSLDDPYSVTINHGQDHG